MPPLPRPPSQPPTPQPPPPDPSTPTGEIAALPVGELLPATAAELAAPAVPVAGAALAAAAAKALAAIVGAFDVFESKRKAQAAARLKATLATLYPERTEQEIDQLVREEILRDREFRAKQRRRIRDDLPAALRIENTEERRKAVQKILDRERRYVQMRERAMAERAAARANHLTVRAQSPLGAYWKLSEYVRTHTPLCVALAGQFWPWEVLAVVHPQLHAGCACRLLPLHEAVAEGLMTETQVPDTADAIRRVKEIGERLGGLTEAGATTGEVEDYLAELFEGAVTHHVGARYALRYPKGTVKGGEFRPKRGGSATRTEGRKMVRRLLRDLIPATPTSPAQRARDHVGEWKTIAGRQVFVPEHRAFEREIAGKTYYSPPGSTHVYEQKALLRRKPEIPFERGREISDTVVRLRQERRVEAAAVARRALETPQAPDRHPAAVGAPAKATHSGMLDAGFAAHRNEINTGTSEVRFFYTHPMSGANAAVSYADGAVKHVEWQPGVSALERAPLLQGRPPHDFSEFVTDVFSQMHEVADRTGHSLHLARIVTDVDLADHEGFHHWNGVVELGRDVRPAIERGSRAHSEGRALTHHEAREFYASIRTALHEGLHGINPISQREFQQPASRALEEALTEELAHELTVDVLRRYGMNDVLRWVKSNPHDNKVEGSYLLYRQALRDLLDRGAAENPEQRQGVISTLKYSFEPRQRLDGIAGLISHGGDGPVSHEQARADAVRALALSDYRSDREGEVSIAGFEALIEPDLSDVGTMDAPLPHAGAQVQVRQLDGSRIAATVVETHDRDGRSVSVVRYPDGRVQRWVTPEMLRSPGGGRYAPQPDATSAVRIQALIDAGITYPEEIAASLVDEDEVAHPGAWAAAGFDRGAAISDYLAEIEYVNARASGARWSGDVPVEPPKFKSLGPGVYESVDGRLTMYRIEGVNPPAWNVEWTIDYGNFLADHAADYSQASFVHSNLADGAASMKDARWFLEQAWPGVREKLIATEQAAGRASPGGERRGDIPVAPNPHRERVRAALLPLLGERVRVDYGTTGPGKARFASGVLNQHPRRDVLRLNTTEINERIVERVEVRRGSRFEVVAELGEPGIGSPGGERGEWAQGPAPGDVMWVGWKQLQPGDRVVSYRDGKVLAAGVVDGVNVKQKGGSSGTSFVRVKWDNGTSGRVSDPARTLRREGGPFVPAGGGLADRLAQGLVIVPFGMPGSGKGTIGKEVAQQLGVPHVSAGDMLRALPRDSDLGRQLFPLIDRGALVPDALVADMVETRLDATPGGIVFDGYPRTTAQYDRLRSYTRARGRPLAFVELGLPENVAVERLLHRGQVEGRADDTPDVIAHRMEVYREQTEPILARAEAAGQLVRLNVDKPLAENVRDFTAALEPGGMASPGGERKPSVGTSTWTDAAGVTHRMGTPPSPPDAAFTTTALTYEWDDTQPHTVSSLAAKAPNGDVIARLYLYWTRDGKRIRTLPDSHLVGEQQGHVPHVHLIKVEDEYRRRGVATALFAEARRRWPTLRHSANLSDEGRTWVESLPVNVGDDVALAAKLLGEGKRVELNQPRQVSVLLDKLSEIVAEARAKGEQAPIFDLCKVSVRGTNLFCAESQGIPRVEMPQLKGSPLPGSRADRELRKSRRGRVSLDDEWRKHLLSLGVAVELTTEKASFLRATQRELNGGTVARISREIEREHRPTLPIFVSRDNYILDGHHQWAALIGVDSRDGTLDLDMRVERIDMPITDLIEEARQFTEEWGMKPQTVVVEAVADEARAAWDALLKPCDCQGTDNMPHEWDPKHGCPSGGPVALQEGAYREVLHPRNRVGKWRKKLDAPRLVLKAEKKLTVPGVQSRVQKVADALVGFYGGAKVKAYHEPEYLATVGSDARFRHEGEVLSGLLYGNRAHEKLADPDFGVEWFRVIAHEAAHSLSGVVPGPHPGFSQTFEEGSAEILSMWFWKHRGQEFDHRDATRVDGKWTAPGLESLVNHVAYREWTEETLKRAASKVGWDRHAIIDEVEALLRGNHGDRLRFRDETTPDVKPPDGVAADVVSLMRWLLSDDPPGRVDFTGDWSPNPERRAEVEQTVSSLLARYDVPLKRVQVREAEEFGQLAGKSNDTIYLSPRYLDDAFMGEHMKKWAAVSVTKKPADIVTHEFGHIVDGLLLREHSAAYDRLNAFLDEKVPGVGGKPTPRLQAGLEAPSAYGAENRYEFFAEGFTDWVLNGEKAHPSSQFIGKLADVALARKVQEAYEDRLHPRDRLGRWTHVRVKLPGKKPFLLRVTGETDRTLTGIEVNKEGIEIAPKGTDAEGRRFTERMHVIDKAAIEETVPHRMNNHYAELEPVKAKASEFIDHNQYRFLPVEGGPSIQVEQVDLSPDMRKTIDATLASIESVHAQHVAHDVPEIAVVGWREDDGSGSYASTRYGDVFEPHYIRIDPLTDKQEISFAHEWGHYLDQQFVGKRDGFASWDALADPAHPFAPLMEALVETPELQKINELIDRDDTMFVQIEDRPPEAINLADYQTYFKYLLGPHEVFARAYAQWVGLRSGNAAIQAQAADQAGLATKLAPTQWEAESFAPVAAALDTAFERLGWT